MGHSGKKLRRRNHRSRDVRSKKRLRKVEAGEFIADGGETSPMDASDSPAPPSSVALTDPSTESEDGLDTEPIGTNTTMILRVKMMRPLLFSG
jgi:hypothetical protein